MTTDVARRDRDEELAGLRAEVETWRERSEGWRRDYLRQLQHTIQRERERNVAEAKVAAVEALADEWERSELLNGTMRRIAGELRDRLASVGRTEPAPKRSAYSKLFDPMATYRHPLPDAGTPDPTMHPDFDTDHG